MRDYIALVKTQQAKSVEQSSSVGDNNAFILSICAMIVRMLVRGMLA